MLVEGKSMFRFSIKATLVAIFAAMAAVIFVQGYLAIGGVSSIHGSIEQLYQDQIPSVAAARALQSEWDKLRIAESLFVLAKSADQRSSASKAISASNEVWQKNYDFYKGLIDPQHVEEANRFRQIGDIKEQSGVLTEQLSALVSSGAADKAIDVLYGPMTELYSQNSDLISSMVDANNEELGNAKQDIDSLYQGTNIEAILTAIVALVFVAIAGIFAFFGIGRPLARLSHAVITMAAGELTTEIPSLRRRDEIGAMARAVLEFRKSLIEKRDAEIEERQVRDRFAKEKEVQEDDRNAEFLRTKSIVDTLAEALGKLADGNLAFRLATSFDGEYRRLSDNFNRSAGQLEAAMGRIVRVSDGIRSSSSEMRSTSGQLAKRTEQQAASLEETAAALNQITATVKDTSSRADGATRKVADAETLATQSDDVVSNAMSAMSDIEESSRQISQIVSVINDMAFQTNLLALNAGVEAARAGEAGKGFAVVAHEVRELAQRSASAAKEIGTLIERSAQAVSSGVSLVHKTGEIIGLIKANVADISKDVRAIMTSARDQATALSEINVAIDRMDQVTQHNAAMVEETSAVSQKLADEAEQLSLQTDQFKLSDATPHVARAA
jgi:methyl-accepting chemotaxis protein